MNLRDKLRDLQEHGHAVASELHALDQRRAELLRELTRTEAQIDLVLELDPTLGEEPQPAPAAPAHIGPLIDRAAIRDHAAGGGVLPAAKIIKEE